MYYRQRFIFLAKNKNFTSTHTEVSQHIPVFQINSFLSPEAENIHLKNWHLNWMLADTAFDSFVSPLSPWTDRGFHEYKPEIYF